MKFGPEVNDVLGGRLECGACKLPEHGAAILRALLLDRAPAQLYINSPFVDEASESGYVLKIHTAPIDELCGYLDLYRQDGYLEESDLSRVVSNKNIRVHLMRRGLSACSAIIQKTNANSYHKRIIQTIAFLPRLLPGLFAKKPISDTERGLLKAASEADFAAIEAVLEKLYNESDLSHIRQRKLLHGIISHTLNMDLRKADSAAQQDERNAESSLRNYMNYVSSAMANRVLAEDLERRIGAMSQAVDEVVDFLSTNKSVSVDINGSTMLLDVVGPLANFDPDAYRIIREKSRSIFLECISGNREDALLFFDALFLEETIKVMIGARYSVEPRYGVRGGKSVSIPRVIQNPHIYYYGCIGQYAADMQMALSKSDYVGLISVCIASGLSLNIPESPVFSKFVSDVTRSSHKVVLLPDGETVTYKNAVIWLKQQKGIEIGGESSGETNQTDGSGD